jgi:tetratricopeptide (TPR) repeat protein
MARLMLDAGRFPEAEMALRTLLRERPNLPRAEFLLAVAMQKQKRYADAEALFDKIIDAKAAFPEINHLFHFLGWSQFYLGKLPESRSAFEEHLRRVKDEPDSIFALGLIDMEEDHVDDAERRFRQAIELQKDVPSLRRDLAKAHARLGDVLLRRDQIAAAEEEFRAAVTAWPNHYEAWAKLARTLDRQGRPEQAERARAEERAAMVRSGRATPEEEGARPDPEPARSAPPEGGESQ